MYKQELIPTNPYDPKINLEGYYGFNQGWEAGQRQLLKYLMTTYGGYTFREMLKQLEGYNGRK